MQDPARFKINSRCLCFTFFFFIFSCAVLDVLSMATVLDDFISPDCRFLNLRKGQVVYVYSKLIAAEGAGVFWSGSVCADFVHCLMALYTWVVKDRRCATAVVNKHKPSGFSDKKRHLVAYQSPLYLKRAGFSLCQVLWERLCIIHIECGAC